MRSAGSTVVDYVAGDAHRLAQVLDALGCDMGRSTIPHTGNIRCPFPENHTNGDATPSCTPRVNDALLYCQSGCGTITLVDLVQRKGAANSPAEAMKWLEELFGIDAKANPHVRARVKKPRDLISSPSITVAEYQMLKGIPDLIAERFELQDVQSFHYGLDSTDPDPLQQFEKGWYTTVLMPNGGFRPRIRYVTPDRPAGEMRWATKTKYSGKAETVAHSMEEGYAAYGVEVLRKLTSPGTNQTKLLVVEGESDVHACHAMNITSVVGIPGTGFVSQTRQSLVDALLILSRGDTDLSHLTVVIWSEPGSAGSKFPADVIMGIRRTCEEMEIDPPRFATLRASDVPGSADDPSQILMDRGEQAGFELLSAAITAAANTASDATNAQAASRLDSPGGVITSEQIRAALGTAKAQAASSDDPEAPSDDPRRDVWSGVLGLEGVPHNSLMPPPSLTYGKARYFRGIEGWFVETETKDGPSEKFLSNFFIVERVEITGDEHVLLIAAPFGDEWLRTRVTASQAQDSRSLSAALGGIGVSISARMNQQACNLVATMMHHQVAVNGKVCVSRGMGWAGAPGASLFGGIEIEPQDPDAVQAFRANQERRKKHPDTVKAAKQWFERTAKSIIPCVPSGFLTDDLTSKGLTSDTLKAAHSMGVLALGTAAAAPLVAPLLAVGTKVMPVCWMTGMGGSGKTLTQLVCASIFAPDGSQRAFMMGADISRAALNASALIARDVPFIVDDVTQMPPRPSSGLKGELGAIEAAASLGMQIFNREPTKRATQTGTVRHTPAYQMTALFSAEGSILESGVPVTAGAVRRITTVESSPIKSFGLSDRWADEILPICRSHGGAAGELLIQRVRDLQDARELRKYFEEAKAGVQFGASMDPTQSESLGIMAMGFGLLYEVCSQGSFSDGVAVFSHSIKPYLGTKAIDGGATTSEDVDGVDRFLHMVQHVIIQEGNRFMSDFEARLTNIDPGNQSFAFGRHIIGKDGTRKIAFLKTGEKILEEAGVKRAMIMRAIDQGVAKRCQQRFGSARVSCLTVTLPDDDHEDDDDWDGTDDGGPDTTADHETDPYGLAQSADDTADNEVIEECPTGLSAYDLIEMPDGERKDMQYSVYWWDNGTYYPRHDVAFDDSRLLEEIRQDALAEFVAIRQAFADTEFSIAELPDPGEKAKWDQIQSIGRDQALQYFPRARAAGRAYQAADSDADKNQHMIEYLKLIRINIMLRIANPGLFVAHPAATLDEAMEQVS